MVRKQSEFAFEYNPIFKIIKDIAENNENNPGIFCAKSQLENIYPILKKRAEKLGIDTEVSIKDNDKNGFPTYYGFKKYLKNRLTDYKIVCHVFEIRGNEIIIFYTEKKDEEIQEELKMFKEANGVL